MDSSGIEESQVAEFCDVSHETYEFIDQPRDMFSSSGLCCLDWVGFCSSKLRRFFFLLSSSCVVSMKLGCGQCQRPWSPLYYSSILSSLQFVSVRCMDACSVPILRISQYWCRRSTIIIGAQSIRHCDYSMLQQNKSRKVYILCISHYI